MRSRASYQSSCSARTSVNNFRSTRNEPQHSQRRVQAIHQGTGWDWQEWYRDEVVQKVGRCRFPGLPHEPR
jgi:hypothetical protein